jgi:hypothetical protein
MIDKIFSGGFMIKGEKRLMKRWRHYIFILAAALFFFFTQNPGCKNPNEYQPTFDSLYHPPPAPELISPSNDTSIWYQAPFPHEVILKWSYVEGAEYYQLQFSNDSMSLPDARMINAYVCSTTIELNRNGYYFWHVRAYNRKWTWYTEWSKIWHFGVFYSP